LIFSYTTVITCRFPHLVPFVSLGCAS
jgi:hypothetical protein